MGNPKVLWQGLSKPTFSIDRPKINNINQDQQDQPKLTEINIKYQLQLTTSIIDIIDIQDGYHNFSHSF